MPLDYEFNYKKIIEEKKLDISKLPSDVRVGITEISNIVKTANMLEAKGKTIKPSTMNRIKALDKWVTLDIEDYLFDSDDADGIKKPDVEKIEEELDDVDDDSDDDSDDGSDDGSDDSSDDGSDDEPSSDPIGIEIDQELEAMYAQNRLSVTFDELKSIAPKTYNVIWDNYDDDEDNGVDTSYYSLIKLSSDEKFNLKKK